MVNTELIKFKEVSKRFKKNLVLDSISFNIPENKITGLIGSSGSGKTTILKLMVAAYKPTEGEVVYLKRNIVKDMKNVERYFGFSTEDGSFYDKLTVKENVYYFGRLQKMNKRDIKKNFDELIKLVGLENAKNTLAGNLSIGMKKRLDITCALIHRPRVLIMDEPTADLDPVLRREIMSLIKKIKARGTTIILTTQILEEADDLFDHVLILHNKKITEDGVPKDILEKYNEKTLEKVFEDIFKKERMQKASPVKTTPGFYKSSQSEKTKQPKKGKKEKAKKPKKINKLIEGIKEKSGLDSKEKEEGKRKLDQILDKYDEEEKDI